MRPYASRRPEETPRPARIWPPGPGVYTLIPLRKISTKLNRIALSFRAKPCSVSTRVDRIRVAEKGTPYGAERPQRGRRHATPGGQATAGALRRGLRRHDHRQQQD